MREAAPQPPQVSLDKIQSGDICLEEPRLDDAYSYAKWLHVPSEHSHANLNLVLLAGPLKKREVCCAKFTLPERVGEGFHPMLGQAVSSTND